MAAPTGTLRIVLGGRIHPRDLGTPACSVARPGIATLRQRAHDKRGDAGITHQTDVLVEITTTNICGADLHMFEGRTDLGQGMAPGHSIPG